MLHIDGSYGEGGGQVLRSSLALSALLGMPVRIENIRARRRNPGLAPQHLTGVQAIARVCAAQVTGAELRSQCLTFVPQKAPQAGSYTFDVTEAARGGSAGATTLVLQTVLLPLAFARGDSRLTLRGGTHVAWSPPFHYVAHVLLPVLHRMGLQAHVEITRWGWYPRGGGEIHCHIQGLGGGTRAKLNPIDLTSRGTLQRVWGISALSNLPDHIARRQRQRAVELLQERGLSPTVEIVHAPANGQGTVVFLVAEYERVAAGFTGLGERGKPAEKVAQEAVVALLAHHDTGAALDPYLADQIILPMALAAGPSTFTTSRITQHTVTNIWVVEQFLGPCFQIEGEIGQPGRITCQPKPSE